MAGNLEQLTLKNGISKRISMVREKIWCSRIETLTRRKSGDVPVKVQCSNTVTSLPLPWVEAKFLEDLHCT